MTLTGGYHRLTKDQEGSSKDFTRKDCKNKCKLETSRLRGWLNDPFMKSTSKCDSKGCTTLSVLMSRTFRDVHGKTDTFQTEDFSAQ